MLFSDVLDLGSSRFGLRRFGYVCNIDHIFINFVTEPGIIGLKLIFPFLFNFHLLSELLDDSLQLLVELDFSFLFNSFFLGICP